MRRTNISAALPLTLAMLALASGAITAPIAAQDAPTCAPVDSIDRFRLLRQMSLDLLGRIPTEAEYASVRDAEDVDGAIVDAMLASDEFFARMRSYHRALLWGSLGDIPNIVSTRHRLDVARTGANSVYYASQAGRVFRNEAGVSCLDVAHTRFDAAGRALPMIEGYHGGTALGAPAPRNAERCSDGEGCRMDGWVMTRPYWAPDTEVRVCAFDAQAVATGTMGACGPDVINDPGCGCGPQLRYCLTRGTGGTEQEVRDALVEEPLRIFESVIRGGGDYFDALRTRATYLNGPAAHYYRHSSTGVSFEEAMGALPEVDYSDREWRAVERDEPHSGALTTLLYLMRFASHRGRANRYYTAFLCQPFESSAEGLPAATDPCSSDPNLSTRCGCASCHERLEPAAAHWGRWRFNGTHGYLSPSELPVVDTSCRTATGGAGRRCDLYYVTPRNAGNELEREMWAGTLQVAAWRTDAEVAAIDEGPRALLEREGAQEALTRCAARSMAQHLLGRDITAEEGITWLPELASSFEGSGHDFRSLIRTIVQDARYRSIR
ncbi:MAG: hypothetical protein M3Y87_03555 [Myxococcota bacterium]|nr:hypothetical protein [Myxococcota bacterium]